jgi:hypothetical protein
MLHKPLDTWNSIIASVAYPGIFFVGVGLHQEFFRGVGDSKNSFEDRGQR